MSDCSVNAMSAPKPLEGQINWCGDHMPTPLNYARYVEGVERVAESIELDDVLLVPVVRCRDCKMFDEHYLKCFRPVLYFDVDHKPHWTDETTFTAATDATPDGYCAWGERKGGGDD